MPDSQGNLSDLPRKGEGRRSEWALHWRWLAASLVLALGSGFGQTFFISLSVPSIQADLALSSAHFGTIYGGATLVSALLLPRFGRRLDRSNPLHFSLWTALALGCACASLALTSHAFWLFPALLALRFTGQGLCSLIAATLVGRQFRGTRGRALGLAGLGYPLSEALFPVAAMALLTSLGWRTAWMIFAVVAGPLMAVLLLAILRPVSSRPDPDPAMQANPESLSGIDTHPAQGSPPAFVWHRDRRFLALTPLILLLPGAMTAIMVHQSFLGSSRGWTPHWMAPALAAFAVTRLVSSLMAGIVIDRVGARRLVPWVAVPFAGGLLALFLPGIDGLGTVFFGLAGISQGLSSSILTAAWAELYGPEILGTVKGRVTMLAIVGSALGPVFLGWSLEAGLSPDGNRNFLLLFTLTAIGLSLMAIHTTASGPPRAAVRTQR